MKTFTKLRYVLAGATLAVALSFAVGFGAKPAVAASCDDVNIVHCGLDGSSASAYIKSFQSLYNKGSDNGHSDLQKVYNWAGLSDSDVKDMSADNTKLGTVYRNGDIKVDGKVVGTDAWVTARFTEGSGFDKISDGVWARKTTTSFQNASAPVIIHYGSDGQVDGVVMVDCGNAVKVTPVKPAPKPVLACTSLTANAVSGKELTYTYTAKATATNTKIVSYVFNFGDGKTQTVTTSAMTATSEAHSFTDSSKTYSATVAVNGSDQTNVTSDACKTSVTITKTVEYCKPGVPVGSAACQDTPDEVVTPVTPAPAEELPNTGAGAVAGIFAGTSAIGTVGYGLIRRRLNRA